MCASLRVATPTGSSRFLRLRPIPWARYCEAQPRERPWRPWRSRSGVRWRASRAAAGPQARGRERTEADPVDGCRTERRPVRPRRLGRIGTPAGPRCAGWSWCGAAAGQRHVGARSPALRPWCGSHPPRARPRSEVQAADEKVARPGRAIQVSASSASFRRASRVASSTCGACCRPGDQSNPPPDRCTRSPVSN